MRRRIFWQAIAQAMVWCGCFAASAFAQAPIAPASRAATLRLPGYSTSTPHPAVVRIYVAEGKSQSIGSGTLIDARDKFGLVITNWHVIRDSTGEISVVFPDGFRSAGRVVSSDSDWDLAALSIWRPQVSPVVVSPIPPQPGELLTIAGYGSEGQYRAATGACTQYMAPSGKHPYELVELGVAARQGDSGGPIFNQRGELAGVLFGSVKGTTTGSYGGRVWKFVEPLLKAELREAPPSTAPPLLAATENPAATIAKRELDVISLPLQPKQPAAAINMTAPPLEPIAEVHESLSPTDSPGLVTHQPFPYRDGSLGFGGLAYPGAGTYPSGGDTNAWLQWFVGRTPVEQAKALLSLIGLGTVVMWTLRWKQNSGST